MHKPAVVAVVVFRCNMDKTLADYIKRTNEALEKEKSLPAKDENQYPVYPEDDGTDAKRNPYSPV